MDAVSLSLHRLMWGGTAEPSALTYRASVLGPALVILVGVALRLIMLGQDVRLHPDEALFAAQARLVPHDLLLRETDLDKPPLTLLITALSFSVFGPTEFAARLPNVLASTLGLAVVYALAAALYQDRVTALVAALLLALSPYDLAFAATAFTDVQATFWMLAAALLAGRDRWAGAGAAAALGFAAKPNVLIMLPLVVALGTACQARTGWQLGHALRRMAGPLLLGIALLIVWDLARTPRSFFELGYTRNNPGRLIRSDELWPRLQQWSDWLGFFTGSRVINVMLLMLLPAHLIVAGRTRSRAALCDWQIGGFALAFVAWHWLIALNTYDRYLHSLMPCLALLAARVMIGVWRGLGGRRLVLFALVLVVGIAMLPGTAEVLRGQAAIGGDQGQHTGIDALADHVDTHLRGAIIYDHWLGWELTYYLGETPPVIVLYSPQPEALGEDMRRQRYPRYFVTPSPLLAAPWLAALDHAGIRANAVYADLANGYTIYQLVP